MSPFAMTGMPTAALTAAMVWYSTGPENPHARVRPCTVRRRIPAAWAIRAMATAFFVAGFGPVRIFSVTGISTARTTASRMAATRGSFSSNAEPAATLQTFFAGQPMLISMICAPRAALWRAASAMVAGSEPAIWTEIGSTSPAWSVRKRDLRVERSSGFEDTISDTARPAPKRLQSCLNGRSVTPAIGATNKALRKTCAPSCIGGVWIWKAREAHSIRSRAKKKSRRGHLYRRRNIGIGIGIATHQRSEQRNKRRRMNRVDGAGARAESVLPGRRAEDHAPRERFSRQWEKVQRGQRHAAQRGRKRIAAHI